jgi:cholest-4-en-3-one 26-monooxygenase
MDIDIFDPDQYVRGVPHALFKRLRAEHPVYFQREKSGPGYWAITKHADIVAISRDPATFSSSERGVFLKDFEENSEELTGLRFTLVNMDPPAHVKYRSIIRRAFQPKVIQEMEPRVRQRVREILDRVTLAGGDFVTEVAQQLPVRVIAEMLGVPEEDRQMVFDWATRLVGFDNPDDEATFNDAKNVSLLMINYAGDLAMRRFEKPENDIVSMLLQADVDGEKLEPMECAMTFMLLIVAGHETTRNTIAGGTLALIEHPAERERLLRDKALLPSAIEEMLRWVSAITYFRRTVMKDTVVRGQPMRPGEKLALYYCSANRDEDAFRDPDRFDVARAPNDHLAFGTGQHVCLGAMLARLEIKLMFEELLPRFPALRLAGPIEHYRSNFINGVRTMPVEYEPHTLVSVAR